jgi:hypothetical protein
MSLTFFEDLCGLESLFARDDNKIKRGFEGKDIHLLEAIYFKSIQIILSNF